LPSRNFSLTLWIGTLHHWQSHVMTKLQGIQNFLPPTTRADKLTAIRTESQPCSFLFRKGASLSPSVRDRKHEPVGIGGSAEVVMELAIANIARDRVPLDFPTTIAVQIQVDVAISTLWAPAHDHDHRLHIRPFSPRWL